MSTFDAEFATQSFSEDATRSLEDAYAAQFPHDHAGDAPPPYHNFEDAYTKWRVLIEAKRALTALDGDLGAVETELEEAKKTLKRLKEESKAAFQVLHPRRSVISRFLGKSKGASLQPDNANSSDTSVGGDRAAEEYKRSYEAEMSCDLLVHSLEERIAGFKSKKQELTSIASGDNQAWSQLHQMLQDALSNAGDFARIGEITEKLAEVDSVYDIAEKARTDITRSRWLVQQSHAYFTRTLELCSSIRGSAAGRAAVSILSDGLSEVDRTVGYQQAVKLACQAQAYLNNVPKFMEPHEHMIPDVQMEDYQELKKNGLLQMVKLYNTLYGGKFFDDGVSETVKQTLAEQDKQFGHLTNFALWLQDQVPLCVKEMEEASKVRDDVRKEIATVYSANIVPMAPSYDTTSCL